MRIGLLIIVIGMLFLVIGALYLLQPHLTTSIVEIPPKVIKFNPIP